MMSESMGFDFRHTSYLDAATNEKLSFNQSQVLFDLPSVENDVSVSVGVGVGTMIGTTEINGLILSLPFAVKVNDTLSLELRPVFFNAEGTTIHDIDTAAIFSFGNVALRLGHRSISSPHFDIDGPYVGIQVDL
jgi:hypothetical protein